jgi:sterol desaturase/sphingolipid hydroxylase (fatty acid hydroxylase superfamily)
MPMHAIVLRLLSYVTLINAARLFMIGAGAWYCYWRQMPVVGPKTLRGFAGFVFPRQLWTHRCVRIDVTLVILRKLTGLWGVVPVVASVAMLSPAIYGALTSLFGHHAQAEASWLVMLAMIVALVLVHDFGEYITHAASHNNRLLWEFHKVHHSTEFMTPLSAKRAHFVDDVTRMIVIGPSLGLAVGVLAYLFHLEPISSSLFGLDAYMIGNVLNFDQLRHSHIPLSYGRAESYLISPAQHQLHHDRYGKPRNFGSFLSLWDRLFGTFAYSAPAGSFEVGLSTADQKNYDAVWKLYVRPFGNLGLLAKRNWTRRKQRLSLRAASTVTSTPPDAVNT